VDCETKTKFAHCYNDHVGLSSIQMIQITHKNLCLMKKGKMFIEYYRDLTVVFDSV